MDQKFICNICEKNYKSYQSLWNHNNRFHKNITSENLKLNKLLPNNRSSLLCLI